MPEIIKTKTCPKCKQIKPVSEFHKNQSRIDGYSSWCKICNSENSKRYNKTERGKIVSKKAVKKYSKTIKYKIARKRYNQSKKGKMSIRAYSKSDMAKANSIIQARKYRQRHKDRCTARIIVNHAVKRKGFPGANTKVCQYCGKQAEQYHHPDYSKSLDVVPLCAKCHRLIHSNNVPTGPRL